MVRTRAQLAAQKGCISSAPKDQGKRPQGIRKHRSTHRTTRLSERPERDRPPSCPAKQALSRKVRYTFVSQHSGINTKLLKDSATSGKRGTKRSIEALDSDPDSPHKRPRPSLGLSLVEDTSDRPASDNRATNPIEFWARKGQWPQEYFEPDMERLLARKKSLSLIRKRSNSATSTPSDQKPREEKSALYRDPRYKTLLATKGSFMDKSDLGLTQQSNDMCCALLSSDGTIPNDSLFRDDLFEQTCRRVEDRNEARIIRDITPFIVPSAEVLCIYGATCLNILIESLNEGWNNSVPLTGTRPQPDYSVGFRREAFTDDQLEKLSPFIGDFITGDLSFFMSTYYMHFPFLTCEVKCGAAALDVADRQNAHSMTLAARAVVELFRLAKREDEVHRQLLAFSISHDHCSVRIYGCYPVIDGKSTKYYRHPIHKFDFTTLDGKDKWTAYRFTKNVYEVWMPQHFKRICSAIDQLPSNLDFNVPSLAETGLSQGLESHSLSQSDVESMSLAVEDNHSGSERTPDTSITETGGAKRRKGKARR
ncbi:hypothetical protein HIM_09071 [Hirsutella minnesotensis 3608]|uniref:DUF7924 domain-containing protein n=1 Tax=Hirsutella minnesotensis 3608 TaxID=1043627 RepID=A0A0F7ZSK7_9HYPO|nr:hypothetical protein HIM_09071 [Hirsutella minnesotensis 3608]